MAAAATTLAGIAGSAASARVIDSRASLGQISALEGYAAWSKPTQGRYRLVIRHRGRIRDAGVPTRAAPFDVSLGKDAHKRVVATYSRCQGRGTVGCRLRILDLRSGRERGLTLRSSRLVRSRFNPVLRGRRVAYKATVRTGGRTHVAVMTQVIGNHGAKRLPGGTSGFEAGPGDISFDGRKVIYTWRLAEAPCTQNELFGNSSELWIDSVTGSRHQLARRAGCPGDAANDFYGGQLIGGSLYFGEILNDASTTNRIGRYDLATQAVTYAPAPTARIVRAVAVGSGRFLLQRHSQGRGVISEQRLTFTP